MASAVGLIVVTGLTKMFIHINSQISYLEKKTQQINLIGIIGEAMRNPSYCTETIKPVESDLRSGTTQELYQIRAPNGSGGGSRAIMELDDDFKANYGMKGIARFEVSCDEGDCTCSSPSSSSPCTKKWSFNLISQSQNNNVPIFNRIMKTPITITFTGSDPDDVSCCQTGESLQNGACVSQPIASFTCPPYFSRWQNSNFCVRSSCPTGFSFTNSGSLCVQNHVSSFNSSRAFKKNIKLFKDYKGALKDIIKTPTIMSIKKIILITKEEVLSLKSFPNIYSSLKLKKSLLCRIGLLFMERFGRALKL